MDGVTMKPGKGGLKHVRVREYVRTLVAQANPGDAAPSERELVARFGVARMTVRQALEALVAEGLLERVPGKGTFVARPRRRGIGQLTSYTEDMQARGMLPESQTLLSRREQAGPGVARALGVSPGDAVIHWKRLRRADQRIMCVEDTYLNEALLPGFLDSGLPTSLYAALEARSLRPTWAEDAICADAAADDEAAHLGIEPGAPVLHISRRALCDDTVVIVARTVYRADRFTMFVQLGDRG